MNNSSHPMRGVLLVLTAVFIFASMDSTGKYLVGRYPVPLVMAVRYLVNLILVVAIFTPGQGRKVFAIQRKGLVWLRSISLALSSLLMGFAFKAMPVAETTAIIYLAPFGVLLLSGPVLGEKVKLSGWIATAIGFAGLLLIVRPGGGLSTSGVIFTLLAAATTVIYHLLSRLLAKTESTVAMLFYSAIAGVFFFGALLPWNWQAPTPSTLDYVLFASIGALSLIGHFLFTAAYRLAPASLLTPVNYVHLAWAALLGCLVFDHIPDSVSLLGILLVGGAGVGNALWNHFKRPEAVHIDEPQEA